VIGKKSGGDSILHVTEKLNLKLDNAEVDQLLAKAKAMTIDKKRPLMEEDLLSLFGHREAQVRSVSMTAAVPRRGFL